MVIIEQRNRFSLRYYRSDAAKGQVLSLLLMKCMIMRKCHEVAPHPKMVVRIYGALPDDAILRIDNRT